MDFQEKDETSSSDDGTGTPWYVWILFNMMIATALYFDLKSNQVDSLNPVRRAIVWSAVWVLMAFVFALLICVFDSASNGATFLVGYLVEKSLSVDNLLVILLIFKHFRIRAGRQSRVLKLGIFGAVVMRALFIFAGIKLIEMFEWTIYVFGAVLLYAAFKMLYEEEEEDGNDGECKATNSVIVRILSCLVPYTTNATTTHFFLRTHRNNRLVATPMFAALLVIEASDVFFAIDSIPCILGLTTNR